MAWTGSDCGRAIRERGAILRAQGKIAVAPDAKDADRALMTLAKLLTATGTVTDDDCRQTEAFLWYTATTPVA